MGVPICVRGRKEWTSLRDHTPAANTKHRIESHSHPKPKTVPPSPTTETDPWDGEQLGRDPGNPITKYPNMRRTLYDSPCGA